jgi:hypothetical protein
MRARRTISNTVDASFTAALCDRSGCNHATELRASCNNPRGTNPNDEGETMATRKRKTAKRGKTAKKTAKRKTAKRKTAKKKTARKKRTRRTRRAGAAVLRIPQ